MYRAVIRLRASVPRLIASVQLGQQFPHGILHFRADLRPSMNMDVGVLEAVRSRAVMVLALDLILLPLLRGSACGMSTHIPCGPRVEAMVTVVSESSAACSQYAGSGGPVNQTIVAHVLRMYLMAAASSRTPVQKEVYGPALHWLCTW